MRLLTPALTMARTLLALLTLLAVGSCSTLSGGLGSARSKADLLRIAENDYEYPGPESNAITGSAAEIGSYDGISALTLTVRTIAGVPKSNTNTDARVVVGRFYLSHDYPRLGMYEGYNYVFFDKGKKLGKGSYRPGAYIVVPANKAAVARYLIADRRLDLAHGTRKWPAAVTAVGKARYDGPGNPRLVDEIVLGLCVEGEMCPAGHCGLTDVGEALQ